MSTKMYGIVDVKKNELRSIKNELGAIQSEIFSDMTSAEKALEFTRQYNPQEFKNLEIKVIEIIIK